MVRQHEQNTIISGLDLFLLKSSKWIICTRHSRAYIQHEQFSSWELADPNDHFINWWNIIYEKSVFKATKSEEAITNDWRWCSFVFVRKPHDEASKDLQILGMLHHHRCHSQVLIQINFIYKIWLVIVVWCNGFDSKRPKIIKVIPKMERCGPIFDAGQTKYKVSTLPPILNGNCST